LRLLRLRLRWLLLLMRRLQQLHRLLRLQLRRLHRLLRQLRLLQRPDAAAGLAGGAGLDWSALQARLDSGQHRQAASLSVRQAVRPRQLYARQRQPASL